MYRAGEYPSVRRFLQQDIFTDAEAENLVAYYVTANYGYLLDYHRVAPLLEAYLSTDQQKTPPVNKDGRR